MECAMTWLGNNRMMQSVTWNSNHTDDDAPRFQAYMRTPSSNAIATRPDRSYYPDYSTRPNRFSLTNGHGSVDRRTRVSAYPPTNCSCCGWHPTHHNNHHPSNHNHSHNIAKTCMEISSSPSGNATAVVAISFAPNANTTTTIVRSSSSSSHYRTTNPSGVVSSRASFLVLLCHNTDTTRRFLISMRIMIK
jgi:hypothetical protein